MKNLKKYFFITLFLTLLLNKNVFAEHSHTNECYINATQHICDGNETTGGNCYNIPLTHIHNISCYDKMCKGGDFEVTHTYVEECDKCDFHIYQETITCNNCNVTSSYTACSNVDCSNMSVPVFEQQMKHNELNETMAIQQGIVICGKEENEIIGYEKTCIKESGNFYDENGNVTQPKCHLIAKSYKPEIEFPTLNNFSNRIIVEYLDGHTDYVVGYSEFEKLDKTISYDNYPITINFSILLNGNSIETEQFVTCYFTNIVEDNNEVESVEGKLPFEIVENTNDIIDDIDTEENTKTITQTTTPTTIEKPQIEETEDNKEENIVEIENNTKNISTTNIILITIIIIIFLIFVFAIINLLILKKKNK